MPIAFGNCYDLFGMTPYISSTIYELGEVAVSSKAIPDINNIYRVDVKKKWNIDKNLSFSLSEEGLIQGAETSYTNKTFEIITSAIGAVADIAAAVKAFTKNLEEKNSKDNTQLLNENKPLVDRITYLLKRKEELVTNDGGNITLEVLKFKIDEIDKLLAKELVVIMGTKTVESIVYKFEVEANAGTTKILKLDKSKGVFIELSNPNILNSTDFNITDGSSSGEELTLSVSEDLGSFGSKVKALATIEPEKKGMAYRVPGKGLITVSVGSSKQLVSTVAIAQLGEIVYLPCKIDKASIDYYENLGFIKKISVEAGSIISSDKIDQVSKQATNTQKLLKGDTDLEKLNKENDLLEAQKKNKELKDALKSDNQ